MNELTYYAIFAALGTIILLFGGLLLADYIMSSLGLMRLAKRRNIPSPWLSWIPVASSWITGSLVDEYDFRNGFSRGWKHWLLWSTTAAIVSLIWYTVESITVEELMQHYYNSAHIGIIALRLFICLIVLIIAGSITNGLNYVCMFKIYESTVPEKALKYFLISLLVPLGQPICLLLCSGKGYDCAEEDDEEIQVEIFEIPTETTEE